jgi:hypothetical protein
MLTIINLLLTHIVHFWTNIVIFYEIHGTYIKIIICLIRKLRETKKEFTSVHYQVHNKIILLTF